MKESTYIKKPLISSEHFERLLNSSAVATAIDNRI
jgi:hypothetical protein